ncbi:MAG: hypothetical protein FJW69_04505 [Actinobacteria bacterium]|nr:hypothetical protein [Actinomycetota bacterium]
MSNLWLDIFLGIAGRYIVKFIDSYYLWLVPLIVGYGIFLAIASYNLKRIEKRASLEIVRQARIIIGDNPNINYPDLIDRIEIGWENLIKKYSFFPYISIESGLWVNKTNVANVRDTIMANERKIHLTLERHSIFLLEEKRQTRRNLYLEYFQRIIKK